MPGIKRKASQISKQERPPKLKKQTTSTTVATATGKLKKTKSTREDIPKLKKASSASPRKLASPKKSPKKPLPLPRFPTLKPTGDTDVDFVFSAPKFYTNSPSSKFTSLKKDKTVLIKSVSSVGDKSGSLKKSSSKKVSLKSDKTINLVAEPTEIVPPVLDLEIDSNATRASDIEKKIQKLPSGSFVGKITNLEFDDLILPSDSTLDIYESTEGSTSVFTGSLESRKSAYIVAEFFTPSETENPSESNVSSTEQASTSISNGVSTQTDLDMPTLCSEDSSAAESGSDNKNTATTPNAPETPSKSPRKVPGGPREIVFSFDTTGSMYNYMEEAGEKIRELVTRLQSDIPGIRLAFVAHGDYYDLKHDRYLIKWIDFGASIDEIAKFFDNLAITHGGDADECYELVLHKVRESLSWTPGSQRSLVIIGDSDPHEPGYKFEEFVNDIDWRVEAALLRDMGVRIYGLQVGYQSNFYRQICQITNGAHLRIDNASFTHDTLMSICLREGSLKLLKSYENEVRKAKKNSEDGGILDLELERLFSALKSVEDNKSSKVKLKLMLQAEKEEKKEKKLEAKKDSKQAVKRPQESDTPQNLPPPKLTKIDSQPSKKTKVTPKKGSPKPVKSSPGAKNTSTKKTAQLTKATIPKKPVLNRKTSQVKKDATSKASQGKMKKSKETDEKVKKSPGRPKVEKKEASPSSKKSAEKSKAGSQKALKRTASPSSKSTDKKDKKGPSKPKVLKTRDQPKSGKSDEKRTKSPGRPKVVTKAASPESKQSDSKKGPGSPKQVKGGGRSSARKTESKTNKGPGRPKMVNKSGSAFSKQESKSKGSPGRPKVLKKTESVVKQKTIKKAVKQTEKKSASKNKLKSTQVTKSARNTPSVRGKKATINTKSKEKPGRKVISTKVTKKSQPINKKKSVSQSVNKKKSVNQSVRQKVEQKSRASTKKELPQKKPVKSVKQTPKQTKVSKVKAKATPPKKKTTEKKVPSKKNKDVKASGPKTGRVAAGKISKVKKLPKSKTVSKAKTQVIKKVLKAESSKATKKSQPATKPKAADKASTQKPDKSTKKSNTSHTKSPVPSSRQLREKATVTKFVMGPLSNISWDNWTPLISPSKPNIKSEEWKKNKSWCSGFCNNELYKGSQKGQAIYEIAVNPPNNSKKYPVFFSTKALWDCFSSPHVQTEVNRVIKLKGSVSVRRGTLPKPNDAAFQKAVTYIQDTFDYAWAGKGRKDSVKIDNFIIARA